MEVPKLSKEDVLVLPLAVIGLVQGVVRYYVLPAVRREPLHIGYLTNGEIDQYIGEQALTFEIIKPHLH